MILKIEGSRNLIYLYVFYAFWTFHLKKNQPGSVIVSSNLCHYSSGNPCFPRCNFGYRQYRSRHGVYNWNINCEYCNLLMASYFISEYCIYNMLEKNFIVLEKCNFVPGKSLKSHWISFLKKCGNLVMVRGHKCTWHLTWSVCVAFYLMRAGKLMSNAGIVLQMIHLKSL